MAQVHCCLGISKVAPMLLVCYHKKILIYPNVVELATAFKIEKKSSRQAGSGAM
jgi:hypothetical protein